MILQGRTSIELAKIYAMGSCPTAISLLAPEGRPAEWRVDMLTGPIPNLGGWWFRHRKQFYQHDSTGIVTGCNILFNNTRWGWFVIDDYTAVDAIDKRPVQLINYNQPENGVLTRDKITDRIRTTNDPNVHLGEFYYSLSGRSVGPFYFSLTRILT